MELAKYAEFHFLSEENQAFASNKTVGLLAHHERHQELLQELHQHTSDLLNGLYS